MKKFLVNFSNSRYREKQLKNTKTAYDVGGFDLVYENQIEDIDPEFWNKNFHILSHQRGSGMWLWKPYVILEALKKIEDGDVLMYSDSGSYFIHSIDPLIEILDTTKEGLLTFTLEEIHNNSKWCKRDVFHYMDLEGMFLKDPQVLASFLIMRKNNFTLKFIEEWLRLCEQENLLVTHIPNKCLKPNFLDFVDGREDQAILSLLAYKNNITKIADISQYGNGRDRKGLPQIMEHTR